MVQAEVVEAQAILARVRKTQQVSLPLSSLEFDNDDGVYWMETKFDTLRTSGSSTTRVGCHFRLEANKFRANKQELI